MSIGGPHEVLPSHGRLCFLQLDVQARAALAGGCGHARPPATGDGCVPAVPAPPGYRAGAWRNRNGGETSPWTTARRNKSASHRSRPGTRCEALEPLRQGLRAAVASSGRASPRGSACATTTAASTSATTSRASALPGIRSRPSFAGPLQPGVARQAPRSPHSRRRAPWPRRVPERPHDYR